MANEEHLKILKQGVDAWNEWREQHPETKPDFRAAKLGGSVLLPTELSGANLCNATLRDANLRYADLSSADLSGASLGGADFGGSSLDCANLRGATLNRATLRGTGLSRANLCNAWLHDTNFIRTDLSGANLENAACRWTVFGAVDLSETGLENVKHQSPSIIDRGTLYRSKGKIPKEFLRGCGLSDWEIEAARLYDLTLTAEELTDIAYEIHRLKAVSPIQIDPIFISYSRADESAIEAIEKRFDEKRVRYWRDVHDMKAGPVETQIDKAIRQNPTVLLVLSENSVASDWVEWEAQKARELEKQGTDRHILCPIALDEAWKDAPWRGPLRHQIENYNILDFSDWEDPDAMAIQFEKLVGGLGIYYGPAVE